MSQHIFTSDRYFTTFDVYSSHGQLLLRSQKNESQTFNIDIIFFGTTYIQLFSRLNGLSIKKMSKKKIIKYKLVRKELSYENNHLFEIESANEKYYISASFVQIFENTLDFNETSLGYGNKGREKEITATN